MLCPSVDRPSSEVSVFHVGVAPQGHLQEARLDPRGVHLLNLVGGMSLLREEGFQRERDREDECEEVPKRHVIRRGCAVGAVFLCAVVTEADLVLIVKPLLVVLGPGRVEDPLAEPLADGAQVVTERLAVAFAGERCQQMWI